MITIPAVLTMSDTTYSWRVTRNTPEWILVQVIVGGGGDEVAEVGHVLMSAGESLQRNQVPGRSYRQENAWQHFQPLGGDDNFLSIPEFAKSRSMNALDVPALGRTRRAVASRFT